jgi:hypothetical protein
MAAASNSRVVHKVDYHSMEIDGWKEFLLSFLCSMGQQFFLRVFEVQTPPVFGIYG